VTSPEPYVKPPTGSRRDPFREGQAGARARRLRSLMIALALLAFVALVFATTIVRLAQNAHHAG
jgi:hypothetical protein